MTTMLNRPAARQYRPVAEYDSLTSTRDIPVVTRRRQKNRTQKKVRLTPLYLTIGAGLALLVAFFVVVGGNYAAAGGPEPTGSRLVHVQPGETLTELAGRVAPEAPTAEVIDRLRDLNSLSGSGLQAGQALIAPSYR